MKKLIVIFLILFIPCGVWGADIRVNGSTGVDEVGCGADGDECATIEYAANTQWVADGSNDRVLVEDGTYTNPDATAIVAFTASGDAEDWLIVEAENHGSAALSGDGNTYGFWTGSKDYIRIIGFDISSSDNDMSYGIYIGTSTYISHDIYISKNTIHDIGNSYYNTSCANTRLFAGIGSRDYSHTVTVDGNTFYNIGKQSRYDNGESCCEYDYKYDHSVYIQGYGWIITNNIFYDHQGGFSLKVGTYDTNGTIKIINNSFGAYGAAANDACYEHWQGHIYIDGGAPTTGITIQNNLFYDPVGTRTIRASDNYDMDNVTLTNNVTSEATWLYQPTPNGSMTSSGNHLSDGFADITDVAGDDFTLDGDAGNCKDGGSNSGSPDIDYADNLRPYNSTVDVGAYEYTGGGSPPDPADDYTSDANAMGAWAMTGNTGNETDLSGESATLTDSDTIPTSATVPSGMEGTSRDFESGDSDYLSDDDGGSTDINGADQSLSICSWFKHESDTSADQYLISKWNSTSGNRQFRLFYDDSQDYYVFCISSDGSDSSCVESSTSVFSTSSWIHACGVYNDTDIRLYINGSLDCTPEAETAGVFNGDEQFEIGRYNEGSLYFDGLIYESIIFDDALTAQEVGELASSGMVGSSPAVSSISSTKSGTVTSGTIDVKLTTNTKPFFIYNPSQVPKIATNLSTADTSTRYAGYDNNDDDNANFVITLIDGDRGSLDTTGDIILSGSTMQDADDNDFSVTLPAWTSGITVAAPGIEAHPVIVGTGGHADWATFAAIGLLENDYISVGSALTETVTLSENGMTLDTNGYGIDNIIISGDSFHVIH
jgi:hypothetical protein